MPADAVATILARSTVPEYTNVYGVGIGATRLTFLSQQHRALNLVWALRVAGKLPARARVAVVGAGLAGVTAAAAAHLLGAEVTLIERHSELLHLQRGTQLRYVLPHIYDWPEVGSGDPFTDLPFFNWGAGMAATIVETILRQWGRIAGGVTLRLSHDVRQIRTQPDGRMLVRAEASITPRTGAATPARAAMPADNTTGVFQDAFDVVILAVGFGLERTLPSIPFLSYWENDNLGRTVLSGPLPRRYLVTGCGDGGLIDALRLRIRDFDHARFVHEILSVEGLAAIQAKLTAIDREAAQLTVAEQDCVGLESGGDRPRLLRRALADRQSEYLWEQYEAVFAAQSARFGETIPQKVRNDTIVYLNGLTPSPLTLNAAILNRVAVFLLFQYGGLRYRTGEIAVLPATTASYVRLEFRRDGYPADELEVHEVIVRHGPRSAIERLLPRPIVEQFVPVGAIDDITRAKQYPDDFWSSTTLTEMRRQVAMDYAAANFPRALMTLLGPRSGSSLSLKVTDQGVAYVVTDEESDIGIRPPDFDRIPVEYRALIAGAAPVRRRRTKTPATSIVRCGVGIAAASSRGRSTAGDGSAPGTGTLGCFVRLSSGGTGLLTAASALADGARIGGALILPGRGPDVLARIVQLVPPVVSAPDAHLSSGTAVQNQYDAAVAALTSDVRVLNEFEPAFKLPPIRTVGTPVVGDHVVKVGLRSGLTRGRISEIDVTQDIHGSGGTCWFNNLFAIESAGDPFSRPGDAGALIVRAADGAALGLLIGGSDHTTLASPLSPLLDLFNCSLLGPDAAKPTPATRTGGAQRRKSI